MPLIRTKKNKCIACACLVFLVIIGAIRMIGSNSASVNNVACTATFDFDSKPLGASSPKEVVERYYKAYKDGDPVAFLNCVNYTAAEKSCIIEPLSKRMNQKDWCKRANIACAKITYECEQFYPHGSNLNNCEWVTANAYVEASDEFESSAKSAGKLWTMKKIDGKWFIDKDSGGSVNCMGVTDLSDPDNP